MLPSKGSRLKMALGLSGKWRGSMGLLHAVSSGAYCDTAIARTLGAERELLFLQRDRVSRGPYFYDLQISEWVV